MAAPATQVTVWRKADFLRLWASETVSLFGTHVTALALPLAAVLHSMRQLERSAYSTPPATRPSSPSPSLRASG